MFQRYWRMFDGPLSTLPEAGLSCAVLHGGVPWLLSWKASGSTGALVRSQPETRAEKSVCGCPLNLVACLLSESTATLPKINSSSSVPPQETHSCSNTREVVNLIKAKGIQSALVQWLCCPFSSVQMEGP